MKRPIAISLSPNTEPDDVRRAWHALLHPKIWEDSQLVLQAEKMLEEWFAGPAPRSSAQAERSGVALTSSGRQALLRTLQAFNIGPGDEVILQAFTCIAVPEAILWTGAKPVYADITSDTYNIDP